MNSARSASPFVVSTSDNLKYTETLRSKARFLHELSKINEFHVKNHNLMMQQHQKTFNGKALKFPSEDVDAKMSPLLDQGLPPEEGRKADSRSGLQRKTMSSSKTIVKVCSKMSLSKRKGRSSKFCESEVNFVNESFRCTSSEVSSNEKNVIPEKDPNAEIKRDAFERSKQTKNVNSPRKAKFALQNTGVKNIPEPFASRAVEVVEIYPAKKKCLANCDGEVFDTNPRENSARSFPKQDASTKSTGVDNGCLSSGVRSNKTVEKVCSIDNDNNARRRQYDFPHTLKGKDVPTKPTRDQQDLNAVKMKAGKMNERTPEYQNDLKETLKFKGTDDLNLNFMPEKNHQLGVKDKEASGEKLDSKGSRESKDSSSKHSSKGVHWSPAIPDESALSGKSDKVQIENKDMTMIKKKIDHELKHQSVFLTSSSESSTCGNNIFRQDFATSNESEFSSSTNSKRSSITDLSKTESSSRENTVIDLQKMESNPEVNHGDIELPGQQKIKIFIEKRENKELNSGKKIDLYGNGDRIVDAGDLKAEECSATRKQTVIEEDSKNDVNKTDVGEKEFVSEEIELKTILLRTYQHLAYDWQRLKSLSMKLGGSISDSDDFLRRIQLLGNTIMRYKDHVVGLNEDSMVKARIMKYCLKDVNKLIKAVKKNKQYLELQERWVERPEWKSFLDRDLTKKRSFLNNVISFSNEWTNEVSYLIETLSRSIKDFVINNEEKENLRNQQQYTTDRRAADNLPVQKDGSKAVRLQTAEVDLTKEDSSVANQMAGFLKSTDLAKGSVSKTLMKTAHTSGNKEREKLLEFVQNEGAEEKIHRGRNVKKSALASANQWKQSSNRQKCRTSTNAQPVWKPGGAAKIPSSFSATTLAKEKVHQLTKNTKDTKHGRATGEHKKKAHMEAYCMRDSTWPGITDHPKLLNKNSSTSLKTSLRLKSKAGTVKAASKGGSEYHQDAEAVITSKHCDKIVKQKISTEPRIQYAREEIIAPTTNIAVDKNTRYNFQSEPTSILFKSFSATEKIKINEEEPTRDTGLCPLVKNLIEFNEHFYPEQSFTPLSISSKDSPIYVATCKHLINKNVGNSRSIIPPTSVSVASASCMANILPVEIPSSKCSRCSLSSNSVSSSIFCQEQRNDAAEQSDHVQENCADRNSTGRNIKKSPIGRKKIFRTNSRVASLSILKEFLHEQGVDPDLVNKAEQCLRENQKRRSSLKKKHTTSIDVSFSEKNLQTKCCGENRSEESIKNCRGDSVECKENSLDIDKSAIPSLRGEVEMKDATTCTTIDNRDASSQTAPSWTLSKSSQSIEPVISLSATQTDATAIRNVATEYHHEAAKDTKESKDAACMTDSSLITDYLTRTVQASYASKSVETELVESNDSRENLNVDSQQDLNKIAQELIEKHRENKDQANDQESIKSCHDEFNILLNKMYEDYESSIKHKENDKTSEQDSVDRETSQSFSCSDLFSSCSDYCVHDKTAMQTESCELLTKEVPSRVMETLQIAAIRANSVYKAIDFYKHNLQEKLVNLKKRRNEIIKQNRNTCEQIVTNLCESNSVASFTNMIEHFGENKNVKVSQSLRRLEVAASFNKRTASTSSTSVSFSEDIEKIETIVAKNCSSKIETRDDGSSKEYFAQMEEKSFEQIKYIRQISCGSRSSLLDEETESEKAQRCEKYSVFTRENLLPLVYGVVCSIVFWCLQFTITCDTAY